MAQRAHAQAVPDPAASNSRLEPRLTQPCPQAFLEYSGNMRGARAVSYSARIEDLGLGDFVKVDCAACHHVALLTPAAMLRVGLSPAAKVLDLKPRLHSRASSADRVPASRRRL
jgi:hypothetical protein